MSDDPLTRFTSKLRQTPPGAADKPTLPPEVAARQSPQGRPAYEAYEAFENEVRTTSVEIRCNHTGLSYFIQYGHMSALVYNFRSGAELLFTGGGFGVTIKGRNLRLIVMALRLHTCGSIQDFHPEMFLRPEPVDPSAPFVESITVEVLRGPGPKKPGEDA
jgi:hypothetical protein